MKLLLRYYTIFFMWRSERYETADQVLYYFFMWRSERYKTADQALYYFFFFMWRSERYETAAQVLYCIAAKFLVPDWGYSDTGIGLSYRPASLYVA
jgi:hypothetical protein